MPGSQPSRRFWPRGARARRRLDVFAGSRATGAARLLARDPRSDGRVKKLIKLETAGRRLSGSAAIDEFTLVDLRCSTTRDAAQHKMEPRRVLLAGSPRPWPPSPTPQVSKFDNIQRHYRLSKTPRAPLEARPRQADFGAVEYFEVYHGVITTRYSQVWWTSTQPAPRRRGQALRQQDDGDRRPRDGPGAQDAAGDVRVPITMAYNHHPRHGGRRLGHPPRGGVARRGDGVARPRVHPPLAQPRVGPRRARAGARRRPDGDVLRRQRRRVPQDRTTRTRRRTSSSSTAPSPSPARRCRSIRGTARRCRSRARRTCGGAAPRPLARARRRRVLGAARVPADHADLEGRRRGLRVVQHDQRRRHLHVWQYVDAAALRGLGRHRRRLLRGGGGEATASPTSRWRPRPCLRRHGAAGVLGRPRV